ncbi:nitroreductase family protein [Halosquirtibacter laminarini]|uniref:Nitroreductase family protein n=1 Tax=Halosquirtibacter laminarini TaxID=3374600 RepID=A0AC61NHL5_9BACT|nr:nitroreductase family protein [Prolixibacteraceae bacterium]
MSTLELLHWKYAKKSFDPNKKIDSNVLHQFKELIESSPTSSSIQPFKIFIVNDDVLREEIKSYTWNREEVSQCSNLLIFACKNSISDNDIEEYISNLSTVQNLTIDISTNYKNMMEGWLHRMSNTEMQQWTTNQTYLTLGVALTAAEKVNIDACPIEGFDPCAVDELLGLRKKGYSCKVMLALGYYSDTQSVNEASINIGSNIFQAAEF